MGLFVGVIDLQIIPGDPDDWIVAFPFTYITNDNELIEVEAGLKTDLASTPRSIWWLYPPFGLYTGAAIVHDQLYTEQTLERSKCDAILLEAMETEGVSWITRHLIYRMVGMSGWYAYAQHGKELAKNKP